MHGSYTRVFTVCFHVIIYLISLLFRSEKCSKLTPELLSENLRFTNPPGLIGLYDLGDLDSCLSEGECEVKCLHSREKALLRCVGGDKYKIEKQCQREFMSFLSNEVIIFV